MCGVGRACENARLMSEAAPTTGPNGPANGDKCRDGDGVACEAAPGGKAEDGTALGAETGEDLDCMDFPSQKAAQDHLRKDPSDPYKLDPERNGVACDIRPTEYLDSTTDLAPVMRADSGADLDCDDFEFQQEAQTVYFQDPSDPNGLDGPNEKAEEDKHFVGNGFACETTPMLASNVEESGGPAGAAGPATPTSALVAAWPHGGGLGLLLDFAALLMVAGGVLALLVTWRAHRSHGGPSR